MTQRFYLILSQLHTYFIQLVTVIIVLNYGLSYRFLNWIIYFIIVKSLFIYIVYYTQREPYTSQALLLVGDALNERNEGVSLSVYFWNNSFGFIAHFERVVKTLQAQKVFFFRARSFRSKINDSVSTHYTFSFTFLW